MREVISLNGTYKTPCALTASRPSLTFRVHSWPGRLPDRKLVLGGKIAMETYVLSSWTLFGRLKALLRILTLEIALLPRTRYPGMFSGRNLAEGTLPLTFLPASPMDSSPRNAKLPTMIRASVPSSPRPVRSKSITFKQELTSRQGRASTFLAPSTAILNPMSSTKFAPAPTAASFTPNT